MDSKKSFWKDFVASQEPEAIAEQLLKDRASVQQGHLPSLLAVCLPKTSSREAAEIGAYLAPPARDLHPSIARLLYDNIRSQIVKALEDLQSLHKKPPEDGYQLASDPGDFPRQQESHYIVGRSYEPETDPTEEEVQTALRVLRFVKTDMNGSQAELDHIISLISDRFKFRDTSVQADSPDPPVDESTYNATKSKEPWEEHVEKYRAQRPPVRQRYCYICRFGLRNPHPVYWSMCKPCGEFNLAGLRISLPDSLKLAGRTALVTGARVNLGYHTALRLLRCGAMVVASTRYPNDAAVRYAQEADFSEWKDRLKVVGADFRTARDAFALVRATHAALDEWNASALDILVNNAAQTLTDSVKKESRAIYLEQQNEGKAKDTGLVLELQGVASYQPRIRGGIAPLALYGVPERKAICYGEEPETTLVLPDGVKDDGRTEMEPYFKSSWVQNLSEIPYEDVISAHAVNTFVPLILFRELLPLMGSPSNKKTSRSPQTPLAYVINVSSREGIFEIAPEHTAKKGKHVHTNMSKAALNMITQTEAASAWRTRRVAMNSVDPGYMSAAPEMDQLFGAQRPIGWEDGAGRVLWPIAIGEVDKKVVWGRFLKHYGATEVESQLERS